MSVMVNVYEAKSQLSDLLKRVEAGEDIVIARAGTPVVRLVPVERRTGERRTGERRGRGCLKGKIWISHDFDKVDDEIIEAFDAAISEDLP